MLKSRFLVAVCLSTSLLTTSVAPAYATEVNVSYGETNTAAPAQTINVENRDGHQEGAGLTVISGILLVNKKHPFTADYAPAYAGGALMSTTLLGEADGAVKNFLAGARQAGHNMYVLSGYRSYGYQESLFNNYAALHGYDRANTFSSLPGQSEHQTGLAFDVGDASNPAYNLQSNMDDLASVQWMMAHCADYGFILRYLKGKEAITGYQYEPWHFRYVGVEMAKAITASGLCLEEYLGDGASLPDGLQSPRRMALSQSSKIALDGVVSALSSVNIDGYTYFRLRDLGSFLTKSKAPFDVSYDESKQSIALKSRTLLTQGDALPPIAGNKVAIQSSMPVTVDGIPVQVSAYNIDGYTYYKLRDLGSFLGFRVDWIAAEQTIVIQTDGNKPGSVENLMEAVSPQNGTSVVVTVK